MSSAKSPDSPKKKPDSDHLDATMIQQDQTVIQPDGSVAETQAAGESKKAVQKPSAIPPPASAKKKKATQLGDFRLNKKLGQGGMGTVYLATQVSLDRKVALKTLSKEFSKNTEFVQRFIKESRAMAKLQHSNVVQVYAADSSNGVHYAAIEFIDGQSMQDWMDSLRQLSVGDAMHITLVCADALQHALEMKMIHRDIKPDNILVTKRGIVKVADFGLAKALDEDVSMTQSGTGMGTPLYMAPEQARNAKHVDQCSDIYALGCTLYYFLTGQLPFTGNNTLELLSAKENGQFTSARKLNKNVSERLDLMIDKMIAKDSKHRYSDYQQLISDLRSLNLASASLSFIDGAKAASNLGASAGAATMAPSSSTRAAIPRSSAEDAARTQQGLKSTTADQTWFVQFKDKSGKNKVSKLTTSQIQKGLQGGMLDHTTKAKRGAKDQSLPLSQFPEFADLASNQAVKAKAESRSKGLASQFSQLDKADKRRKRWRWLRNLISSTKGLISLIIYLAIIAGVLFAAYQWGMPFVKGLLKS